MSGVKWTNEQWDAITARDCNLLVAAAAGAGKTAVLVERIIKKITDEENPTDIDKLLVVTFTNAAATEMRERIADAISKVLEEKPDSNYIRRQLILLNKASIMTLHSFCTEVIRSNFQSLDIDPGFRIADETESTLMKLEALNEVFEEQYENENNSAFFDLLDSFGGNRGDERLMDLVLELHSFVQSSPWPEEWLETMVNEFNIVEDKDFGATRWGRVLLSAVKIELEGIKNMMLQALEIIKSEPGLENYTDLFREETGYIEGLLSIFNRTDGNNTWDTLYHFLNSIEFARLPRTGKDVDKSRQEQVKKCRDAMKESIKRLKEKVVTGTSRDLAEDLRRLYPRLRCLKNLVIDLMQKYAEIKKRREVLDFNDLEHLCLEILTRKDETGDLAPSDIALKYREKFAEILVDEYQDSNYVQELIIKAISKEDEGKPNIFMVGDVKQSIYRFRQARPELFLEKYNTYSLEKESPFRKILLYKNFRSRKSVVDAINYIFNQIMSVNVGELDYTDTEKLNAGAVYPDIPGDMFIDHKTEIHLIQTDSDKNSSVQVYDSEDDSDAKNEEEGIIDNIQTEARLIAKRIHKFLMSDEKGKYYAVFDKAKKEYRKVEFRDIVILLRTTKNWADVFVEELAAMGIPAFADTGSGFFKTIEVQVVLSLLQIIDNPLQDIPLLSVLRSPVCGFSSDELAEIRLAQRKGPIYHALKKYSDGRGKSSEKAKEFLDKLSKWRDLSFYLPTDELIWRLYIETGYYTFVGAMPQGEQRQANLRILFERARQFEETSYKGLFNFINFIDKLKSSRGDMGSAKILSENDNVVRIMSIHKSKGLEFPIVFLAGCGKKFNFQDMNRSILFHQELGFGPEVIDLNLRISYPSAAKLAIREKIKSETLSEEMRILYVALTRAREKLIITGAAPDLEKALATWKDTAQVKSCKLPDYEMVKARNFLDWIMPPVIRHKGLDAREKLFGDHFDGYLMEDSSQWQIELWNKKDVLSLSIYEDRRDEANTDWLENQDLEQLSDNMTAEALSKEVERRLNWEYPYMYAADIPAKISVTELKRHIDDTDENAVSYFKPVLVKKPMFLEEEKGLSAAEKGTILHFIMQHLDLERISGIFNVAEHPDDSLLEDIKYQVEKMVAKELLTRQQADSIDIRRIAKFLNSGLGQRLLKSKSVNREVPFNMEVPCSEIYSDITDNACKNETILLQGIIDCYFEEDDGIVLLDYKTDYVKQGMEHKIKENYRSQIEFYTRAIETITEKKVKEKYIYLFSSGSLLEF